MFISGCSVTRNLDKRASFNSGKLISENVLESVRTQNLTDSSFFIQKAEIEVNTQNGKERFIGNIKFEYPDKYLISIKSRSGIEGVRIYISKDTILVNDRMNKKIYYGTSYYLKKKYGISQSCLPLIFGDIVLNKDCEDGQGKCLENLLKISCLVDGVMLSYDIDCQKGKVILADQINNFVPQGIKIKNESFYNIGHILIPKIVELEDSEFNESIRIKILKVEFPWHGTVRFIPGKGYELIELE
jgi:hypothetical protein